ncbi:bifunctional DNA-formamidopyrimidine glycosylase/DNA-(apurinic or apyrimidinic site) lyase [Longispora albida]|uniref:bifunctional DNA-formamidopyrimidine glycosylase/DNA-(apurinic or apyrimidinic site) lyase n=1 Tax=Longispora albida TaxID=203523 RepID=UPI0003669AF3|nr:bifunctional DNA-formamidopyrimidine glycosylase/DNA-(apurinic or apyrimidinic site) lyase [Longispora albida]
MPELPEVETIRAGLQRYLPGRTVTAAQVLHPRSVRNHEPGPGHFAALLAGRKIVGTARRGKYLWLPLDSGDALLCHLGMSGQFLLKPAEEPAEKHLRVRLSFADDGPELRFVDQRIFGYLDYAEGGAELPASVAHIARDPLDPLFDDAEYSGRLRRKKTEVKRSLLDQTLISGIGNIYADEALWRSRLHWSHPVAELSEAKVAELLGHVRDVLREAVSQGGTSFDAQYVNVEGEGGYFALVISAYGREGQPCHRCATPIRRDPWMNRSAYSCPTCQPPAR